MARGTGGCEPTRSLNEITFYDVYKAVDAVADETLFHFHENPNPKCPVGRNIHALLENKLTPQIAAQLLPERNTLVMVWRYLAADPSGIIEESPICLCRKIVRWTNQPMTLGQMMTCLDIFRDVGLLEIRKQHKYITIRLTAGNKKADLNNSATMQRLLQVKES